MTSRLADAYRYDNGDAAYIVQVRERFVIVDFVASRSTYVVQVANGNLREIHALALEAHARAEGEEHPDLPVRAAQLVGLSSYATLDRAQRAVQVYHYLFVKRFAGVVDASAGGGAP